MNNEKFNKSKQLIINEFYDKYIHVIKVEPKEKYLTPEGNYKKIWDCINTSEIRNTTTF